jgi:hypothetical protein
VLILTRWRFLLLGENIDLFRSPKHSLCMWFLFYSDLCEVLLFLQHEIMMIGEANDYSRINFELIIPFSPRRKPCFYTSLVSEDGSFF